MLVYGGVTVTAAPNNPSRAFYHCYSDLWTYDSVASVWSTDGRGGLDVPNSNATLIPPGRGSHASALLYYLNTTVMLVHGGFGCNSTTQAPGYVENKTPLDDLWIYNISSGNWTQLVTSTKDGGPGPGARHGHRAIAFLNNFYIFGGFPGAWAASALNDVWMLNMTTLQWSLLQPDGTAPAPRGDYISNIVDDWWVIAGGSSSNDTLLNDTNVLDFNEGSPLWLPFERVFMPAPLGDAPSAVIANTLIVPGGIEFEEGINIPKVFEQELFSASSSGVVSLCVDENMWRVKQADTYSGESFGLAGTRPYARQGHSAVTLQNRGEDVVVVFGGINTFSFVFFNDLWTLHDNGTLWVPAPLASTPPPTSGMASLLHDNTFYMVEGWTMSFRRHADLWAFDMVNQVWALMTSSTEPPPARALGFLGFDGARSLVLFGGTYNTPSGVWVYFGDTWIYDLQSRQWQNITADLDVSPPPRAGGLSVYHAEVGFIICGGKSNAQALNDVWRFRRDLATFRYVWEHLSPVSGKGPEPRWGHTGAILQRNRTHSDGYTLFVVGGRNLEGLLADVWNFEIYFRLWTQVSTTVAPQTSNPGILCNGSYVGFRPAPRVFASSTPMPGFRKFVMMGGAAMAQPVVNNMSISRASLSCFDNAVWMLDAETSQWTYLQVSRPLFPRIEHVAVRANNGSDVLVFGGSSNDSYLADMGMITLGCNRGSASRNFAVEPCELCPMGTYAATAGMAECSGICVDKVTTKSVGSWTAENCTECDGGDQVCSGHGSCRVTNDHTYTCRCHFGWTWSQDCRTPTELLLLAGVFAGALILGLFSRRFRIRLWKARQETKEIKIKLEQQTHEVQELTRDWLIRPQELELMDRIDKACEGAFAEVYLARWHKDLVAVKRLKASITAMNIFNGTITSDFEREIRTLRRTRHRNVVLFYGAGEWAGCSFLVIEYCERGSLRSIIVQQPALLDNPRCRRLALDAARGMRFLHSLSPPQIHRDLKSANLLVTDSWVCKVADLGTARLIHELKEDRRGSRHNSLADEEYVMIEKADGDETHPLLAGLGAATRGPINTRTMTIMVGTVPWMAPEVMKGLPYGTPCDVYSFGVVLWELMSLRLPYEDLPNLHVTELMDKVMKGMRPFPLPPDNREELRPLVALMRHCWRAEPAERPDFNEIVERLENLL